MWMRSPMPRSARMVIAGEHGGDGLRAVADVDLPQEIDAYLMAGVPDRRLDEETVHLASGSLYVPSCSIGFCVAITMNGCGTSCVTPSTVTFCSSMTSSSADWVFGEARLISSRARWTRIPGPRGTRTRRASGRRR